MRLLSFTKRIATGITGNSFRTGFDFAADGALLFGVPFVAYEMGNAKRGEMIPTLIGSGSEMVTAPLFTGMTMWGMSALIPGVGTGMAAVFLASIVAAKPTEYVADSLTRYVREFGDISRNVRRLEMGGMYQDTDTARFSRMSAIQDMNATLMTPRRLLGQEARLMHR